jgi:4-hydroxy-tetrahydrodipicolinate reductase
LTRARTSTLADDPLGGTVRRTVLPSGLRILTEAVPAMRSVSFGVWVGVGSRDETSRLAGVSHFLEHLLFKGTRRRTALEISAAIEAVGGETNAFTTKEYTCYYARMLDEDLPLAIDVICDLVADSVLTEADVETERAVILEEIAMHDDEPDEEVHDVFATALFGEHALARMISGTADTISPMGRRQILNYYHRRYQPPSIVVAAAGNLDHSTVVRLVKEAFARSERLGTASRSEPHRVVGPGAGGVPRPRTGTVRVREKDTEQAHLVLGGSSLSREDDRRFALGVLNNIVGGGMSSRLFQEIREKRGLAYSIYSYVTQYADSGMFGVYAGCAPGKVEEVLGLTREELGRVAERGLRDEEVARGKGMLKGSIVLGLEDTGSRMSRLGKGELLYDEMLGVDDILHRVSSVTPDQVQEVARDILGGPMSLAVIGPFTDDDFTRRQMGACLASPPPRSFLARTSARGIAKCDTTCHHVLSGSPLCTKLCHVSEVPADDTAEREPTRVGVLGARGRMGTEVCRAVDAAGDLELVAMVDQGDWLFNIADAGAEVVVDFTTPESVMDHVHWCIDQGINVVVGTSGFTEARYDRVRTWLARRPDLGVIVAPNFAVGAVLMMEFAAKAARFFDSVEIVEMHHPNKVDAPSGTAVRTAEMVAAVRAEAEMKPMPDATTDEKAVSRGLDVAGVRVHSIRSAGLVAHQEVLLGTPGETLTIRHESYDRMSFMPGVLLAIRQVVQRPGLTIGLGPLLER